MGSKKRSQSKNYKRSNPPKASRRTYRGGFQF